jgi:hypothetical protein
LRANGSRECAPDNKLRESNPSGHKASADRVVAFAPRNNGDA